MSREKINRRDMLWWIAGLTLGSGLFGTSSARSQTGTTLPLKVAARTGGVIVGIQADRSLLQLPGVSQFVGANFDMLSAANLKWNMIGWAPGKYNFTEPDFLFDFAAAHQMRVHAHNLCWVQSSPAWFASVLTKQNARQYLTEHIQTVMTRYKGRVDSWDVVNEPVRVNLNRLDGLNQGPWLDLLGPEYIDVAFHSAAQTDPLALRVLNLDNTEQEGPRGDATRKASLTLIKQLLDRGVPVQAIGLESHIDGGSPTASSGRDRFLGEVRDLGLQVIVTELDVNDTLIIGNDRRRKEAVAGIYYNYTTEILPAADCKRLIFWSLTDRDNWYDAVAKTNVHYTRSDGAAHFPGLLDDALQPNPAFAAVEAALTGKRYP